MLTVNRLGQLGLSGPFPFFETSDGDVRRLTAGNGRALGSQRQRMCRLYVAGLIGPGDRKSVQPMAERLAPGDYDQLHHFVAPGVKEAPLETELLIQADKLVGGSDAVLVIEDTSMPKKGDSDRLRFSIVAPSKRRGKKMNGPPPQPSLPAVRHAIVDLIMRPLQRCPNCRRWVGAGLQRKLNLPK
jgi:DDE superfamily endonuclease